MKSLFSALAHGKLHGWRETRPIISAHIAQNIRKAAGWPGRLSETIWRDWRRKCTDVLLLSSWTLFMCLPEMPRKDMQQGRGFTSTSFWAAWRSNIGRWTGRFRCLKSQARNLFVQLPQD
jgi:hypothetical protein